MTGFWDILASSKSQRKEKPSRRKNDAKKYEVTAGDELYQKIIKDDEYLCLVGHVSNLFFYKNINPNPIWPNVAEGLKKDLDDNPAIVALAREIFIVNMIDDIEVFKASLFNPANYDTRYYDSLEMMREDAEPLYLSAKKEFKKHGQEFRFIPSKAIRNLNNE